MNLFDWCFEGSFSAKTCLDAVKINATKQGFQHQQPTTFEETQAEKALLSSRGKLVPKRTSVFNDYKYIALMSAFCKNILSRVN